jgi:hypothetical protein
MKTLFAKLFLCGLMTLSLAGCVSNPINGLFSHASTIPPGKDLTSPAPTTLQVTVDKEVAAMWIVAVLLGIAAGVAAYPFQNYFVAIHLGVAAIALPIVATIWALFWGWIVAGVIVGVAVWVFVHYKTVLMPAISNTLKKI